MADVEYLRGLLRPFPDWPKKVCSSTSSSYNSHLILTQGIVFLDIFPLLRDPVGFETLITHFVHHLNSHTIAQSPSRKIDVVVGLDARGFLLGPIIAMRLGAAFVPVRKKGKLPGEVVHAEYEKEYGVVRVVAPQMGERRVADEETSRTSLRCRRTRSNRVRPSWSSTILWLPVCRYAS